MNVDILVAEIGSTTTMVNAFSGLENDSPRYLGQGVAPTSIDEGDVRIGLDRAVDDLKTNLAVRGPDTAGSAADPGADKHGATAELQWDRFFATSSAAGGLRMTVHGLAYDMTVRAGREAALGAGANLHHVTAGKLRDSDIDTIRRINPSIILVAGGVDYGERETALHNAGRIATMLRESNLAIPVIYAGNKENHREVAAVFEGLPGQLHIVENVYPRIDELNVVPTRAIIQDVFEKHITRGPGMEFVRDRVDGPIIPTPGAVLLAAQVLQKEIGDLLVLDVGGATTDVHSVTAGSEEVQRRLISPEPDSKRTVEGDLGTYVSRHNILREVDGNKTALKLGLTGGTGELEEALRDLPPIPVTPGEVALAEELARIAARTALIRHAGRYRSLYGPEGKKRVAEGKDLTAVQYVLATGGALTRLPGRARILQDVLRDLPGDILAPPQNCTVGFDLPYNMASLGVLSTHYERAATTLLHDSFFGTT